MNLIRQPAMQRLRIHLAGLSDLRRSWQADVPGTTAIHQGAKAAAL
jgi:hypothetical protein